MRIYVDDISGLTEAARRFTASLGWEPKQPEPLPDFSKGIDPALPKKERERKILERKSEWISQQRKKMLRKFDLTVLIWLTELDEEDQGRAIWQMVQEGIILDPGKVDDMIADWNASLTPGTAQPTEARKMSDNVLDRWTQYVHVQKGLLDDPESLWDNEWPEIE